MDGRLLADDEQLLGQGRVLDGLVPSLLGLERTRDRRIRPEPPGGGPVVQVVGGRLSGRTALLHALYRGYNGRVPLARADLTAPGFGERGLSDLPEQWTPHASPVTQLLYLLSYTLGLRANRYTRPVTFPRLSLGLLVVTAWKPAGSGQEQGRVSPAGLRAAEEQLRDVITVDSGDQRRRKELLRQWSDAVVGQLPVILAGLPGLDALARGTISTARDQLLAPRADRGALRWWGERLHMFQGDALQRLFTFVRDFRRPDGSRDRAESLLTAAFLADIAAHYGLLRRWNQAPPPLLLLDNTHDPLGTRFLGMLAKPAERAAVRPVVVATALGDTTGCVNFDDLPTDRHLLGAELRQCEGTVLRLAVPAVRRTAVMDRLAARDHPAHLPRTVERLSGGRAGVAKLITDDLTQALGPYPRADADRLLYGPGRRLPASDAVLSGLLPDPVVRRTLTLLSPALDDHAARRLHGFVAEPDPPGPPEPRPAGAALRSRAGTDDAAADDDTAGRVRAAKEELAAEHWQHTTWPGTRHPLVTDRTLRAFLLDRLRAEDDGQRWGRVHLRLRSAYNPRDLTAGSAEHGPQYLHHSLALGETGTVDRCLHHLFTRAGPAEWLAAVNLVCAAPHPPEGTTAGRPVRCQACSAPGGSRAVHRAVHRLVEVVWRCSGPLAPAPDDTDLSRVESALHTLYEHNDTQDHYLTAMRLWPARLKDGDQAPDLPLPGGARP